MLQLADSTGTLVQSLILMAWIKLHKELLSELETAQICKKIQILHWCRFHFVLKVDIYLDDEGNEKVPVPR